MIFVCNSFMILVQPIKACSFCDWSFHSMRLPSSATSTKIKKNTTLKKLVHLQYVSYSFWRSIPSSLGVLQMNKKSNVSRRVSLFLYFLGSIFCIGSLNWMYKWKLLKGKHSYKQHTTENIHQSERLLKGKSGLL